MEINQLKYFITTAQYEHITKASYALNITQSALSRVIMRMEDELGVKLFDRKGPIIALNDYGRALLYHAEKIMSELSDLNTQIEDLKKGATGIIHLGIAYPFNEDTWLSRIIGNYMESNPDVSIRLYHMDSEHIKDGLDNRRLDMGITTLPMETHSTIWKPLFTEEMGVIMSQDNPLSSKQSLRITDLRKELFLCEDANSDSIPLTKRFCAAGDFSPNIRYAGDYPHMIADMISRNKGIAFITEQSANANRASSPLPEERRENITFRPLVDGSFLRKCGVIYPRNRYVTRACSNLISDIVANCALRPDSSCRNSPEEDQLNL